LKIAAACCVSLAALTVLSLRQGRTLGALNRRSFRPNEADLDIIAHKLGTKLGLSDEASLGTLSDRMDEMRRDFDWLVSDRMIEQAVDMARLGQSHDSIAQTTGVSSAELDAIRKLRRH
jgi:hypothetical protein